MSEKITDQNPEIRAKIRAMYALVEDSFLHALKNGQKNGEIPMDMDVKAAAHHLIGTAIGAATMGRGAMDGNTIRDFIKISTERLVA